MKYNKKFIIENDFGHLNFEFDYFIKKEFSIEFYKDGILTSFLALDKDIEIGFSIIHKMDDTTLIAFKIKN